MLAVPVSICAFLAREVYRSVGPESLLTSWGCPSVEPWEGTVLLVGGNEETLPVLDLPDPPEVGRDKTGVFSV